MLPNFDSLNKAALDISEIQKNGFSSLKIEYIMNQLTSNMHPNQTEEAPPFFHFMLSPYLR